jgi:hypothetical protein
MQAALYPVVPVIVLFLCIPPHSYGRRFKSDDPVFPRHR